MTIALIILLVGVGFLAWTRVHTVMAYFQQEEYDNARFLRAWPSLSLIDLKFTIAAMVLILLGLIFSALGLVFATVGGAAVAVGVLERRSWKAMKKPLVRTARAMRIIRLTAALLAGGGLVLFVFSPLLAALVVMQAVPAAMMLANLMLTPAQTRENQGYIDQATAKLAQFPGVKIGITGSFGKTTVKHALGDTLGQLSTVYYSTGSINTVLGLTRHVRQRLQPAHRYFVAEMGAYGVGSIQRLCELVDPDHAIVTSIGLAHNERFKGLDVVAQAKSELAAWVADKGGLVVLTQDVASYGPFARIIEANRAHCVIVGEDADKDHDFLISNTSIGAHGTSLTLTSSAGAQDFALPLLGGHNVDNLALIAALLLRLEWGEDAVRAALGGVGHVPHRLAPRPGPNGSTILDDAYNANPVGMRSAMQMAADMAAEQGGKAYMITPGLVELGELHDSEHELLGRHAGELLDKTIVVTPERVPTLSEGVRSVGGFVETAPSYLSARTLIDTTLDDGDVLLIANDLPDLLGKRVFI